MAQIDLLFKALREKKGSDLHLSPGNPPLMRAAGDLVPVNDKKMTHAENQSLLHEIMNDAQKQEFEKTRDIDFAYDVPALESRISANIFLGRHGHTADFCFFFLLNLTTVFFCFFLFVFFFLLFFVCFFCAR